MRLLWTLLLMVNSLTAQTLFITGHSDAGYDAEHAWTYNDFPGWKVIAATHYSEPCAYLLEMLPYDMKLAQHQNSGLPPDVVLVFLGGTDSQNNWPYPAQCIADYIHTLNGGWPNARIIWPNVHYSSVKTMLPPWNGVDSRCTVLAYNQAEADPSTGLRAQSPFVVLVDITSFSSTPMTTLAQPCEMQLPWGNGYVQFIDFTTDEYGGYWYINVRLVRPILQQN